MSEQLRHTFVFRGQVEFNPALAADATHFVTAKQVRSAIRQPKVDGLVFGFMEAPEGVVITQVDEVFLEHPVLVQAQRHLDVTEDDSSRRVGDWLSPSGRNVSECAALSALEDAVEKNPRLKVALDSKRSQLRPK